MHSHPFAGELVSNRRQPKLRSAHSIRMDVARRERRARRGRA